MQPSKINNYKAEINIEYKNWMIIESIELLKYMSLSAPSGFYFRHVLSTSLYLILFFENFQLILKFFLISPEKFYDIALIDDHVELLQSLEMHTAVDPVELKPICIYFCSNTCTYS